MSAPADRRWARSTTATRVLDAALASFSSKGYEATSLDALAGQLGVTKQTILHHFGSKEQLLAAVLERTVNDVATVIEDALGRHHDTGWPALERVVRAVFGLAGRRPELLGLMREVGRVGGKSNERLVEALAPLTVRGTVLLSGDGITPEAAANAVRASYAYVIGVVTEAEVLGQLGGRATARLLLRRRRELLGYLSVLLGLEPGALATRERSGHH